MTDFGAILQDFLEDPEDLDNSGHLDGGDLESLGITPGSEEAKSAWDVIESQAIQEGMYQGHPLRPGVHNGDGDFDFLVDRLIWRDGHSPDSANAIAGAVNKRLQSGG